MPSCPEISGSLWINLIREKKKTNLHAESTEKNEKKEIQSIYVQSQKLRKETRKYLILSFHSVLRHILVLVENVSCLCTMFALSQRLSTLLIIRLWSEQHNFALEVELRGRGEEKELNAN